MYSTMYVLWARDHFGLKQIDPLLTNMREKRFLRFHFQ